MADNEDHEWDVFYRFEWVGTVYATTRQEALAEAKFQFEHEAWNFSDLTVARNT